MSENSLSRKRAKADGIDVLEHEVAEAHSSLPPHAPTVHATPPLSYASILRNKETQSRMEVEEYEFTEDDCSYVPGHHGLGVQFSDKVIDALNKPWQSAVIINLMGKPNSVNTYEFILKGLRRKWKSSGEWKLIDIMNDYFIVKFELESDMNEALCGGPWILAGQTLVVRKWSADFDARTDKIGSMAIWVRIMGLPIRYFNEYAIFKIGKLLGDVVKVDSVTMLQERGRFARVCIEIDLAKPFKPSVEVDGADYGVKYEGLSLLCFTCGMYGHAKDHCSSSRQDSNPSPTDNTPIISASPVQTHAQVKPCSVSAEIPIPGQNSGMVSIPDEDFGPWMLIDYKSRKKASQNAGGIKSNPTGSRFNVLSSVPQNDHNDATLDAVHPPIITKESTLNSKKTSGPSKSSPAKSQENTAATSTKAKSVPEIIQMWTCLQSKLKEKSVLGTSIIRDNAKDAADISKLNSLPINASLSNYTASSSNSGVKHPSQATKNKTRAKMPRKNVGNIFKTNQDPPVAEGFFPAENHCSFLSDNSTVNFSGFFGRCPPEEIPAQDRGPPPDTNMDINPPSHSASAELATSPNPMVLSSSAEECPSDQ